MNTLYDKIFYHIYPLGFCGAPPRNDFSAPAGKGLRNIAEHIFRFKRLGVNALYLGPVFESTAHGYDTLDYYHVDRRLGGNDDLRYLSGRLRENGVLLILDGVFNHSGRHFFAFKDLQARGSASDYRDWYAHIDFNRASPLGDPFNYAGWKGCYDLVKFNGHSRAVRDHLFGAVRFWIEEFNIDGLRLDAADELLPEFMEELAAFGKSLKADFWLMGEAVLGDYRHWAREHCLDSVTNYELYKSLWSSFNDRNFFELSWTLNRQSGPEGMYRHIGLYNFTENHDVNRAASILKNKAHLFPLYGLLFTVPGIPSIYYGGELAVTGEHGNGSDAALRPSWTAIEQRTERQSKLQDAIIRFAGIRKNSPALMRGSYRQIHVAHEQFAFTREDAVTGQCILAVVNGAENAMTLDLPGGGLGANGVRWRDLLNGGEFQVSGNRLTLPLYSSWLRILERR